MLRLAWLSLAALLGCAVADDPYSDTHAAEGPLVGVDGSKDSADRNCHVVLRDLGRNTTGSAWETVGSSWVWQGSIEISDAAAAEGLVPRVLYGMGSDWKEVVATPADAAATPGFHRFTVRIHEGLTGPGWSGTAIARSRIEVVPFLPLAEGGRLFDHNRHPGDLDNYVMTSPDFAVSSAPDACTPAAGPQGAKLVFAADHSEHREGVLAPGGEVTIVYDTNRLTTCRHARNGNPLWEMTAHVLFEPGGERRAVSVRDAAATLAVPPTASAITLWFENTSASGCQAWDSNLGANYRWQAARAPQWVGEIRNLITRGGSDACDGGSPASAGFAFDTWARQRAAITNLCFQVYQPGITDRDDAVIWQELDVQMKWRHAGETTWRSRYVDHDRRVGNNARYHLTWRDHDPFRSYHCPEATPTQATGGESLAVEYFLVVNGLEVRPAPGAAYAGMFADAPSAWRDANCR